MLYNNSCYRQVMDNEEGWVLYAIRGVLTLAFWGALATCIVLVLRALYEKGFSQIKQSFIQLAEHLLQIKTLLLRNLKQKLRKQYRILQLTYTNIPQTIRAIFIIIFEQVVKTMLQTFNIIYDFLVYYKDQDKKQANPDKAIKIIMQKLVCPISNRLMKQPIMLSECGHTFDRESLDGLILRKKQCPICKVQYNRVNMKKNFHLEQLLAKLSQDPRTQSQQQKRNLQLKVQPTSKVPYIIIIFLIVYSMWPSQTVASPQTFKSTILKKYNIYDENVLTVAEYHKNRDKFVQLLNYVESGQKLIIYRNNAAHQMEVNVKVVKTDNFITELYLNGKGDKGSWVAEGFFMPKSDGLYFWMLITEIQSDGSSEKYENDLIFESYVMKTPISAVSGKWYYLGQMTNPFANGQWKLPIQQQLKTQTKEQGKAFSKLLSTPQNPQNDQKTSQVPKVAQASQVVVNKQIKNEEL